MSEFENLLRLYRNAVHDYALSESGQGYREQVQKSEAALLAHAEALTAKNERLKAAVIALLNSMKVDPYGYVLPPTCGDVQALHDAVWDIG